MVRRSGNGIGGGVWIVDLVGCGGFGVVVDGVGLWMVDVRMGMIFKVEQTGTDGWMDGCGCG